MIATPLQQTPEFEASKHDQLPDTSFLTRYDAEQVLFREVQESKEERIVILSTRMPQADLCTLLNDNTSMKFTNMDAVPPKTNLSDVKYLVVDVDPDLNNLHSLQDVFQTGDFLIVWDY